MNTQDRIKYFEGLLSKPPYSWKDIYYKGKKQKLPVYEIDLDYLVYNQLNGRISSLVKSHFNETGIEVDASTKEGVALIEKFLWTSNETANKITEKSIYSQGQNEYGIVTKDGVVIDGNRRSMILRRVAKEKKESPVYFLGVVLEESLNDNPKEIMSLETRYQMGEDAKVDYNAIEKYLKCKIMKEDYDFPISQIAKDMGEKDSVIEEYLSIMELMDKYLDYLGYRGIYTRLEKTEDLFINLNKVLNRWKSSPGKVNWGFDDSDLSNYKKTSFDLIRYVYNSPKGIDAKDVREKLIRNSEDTIFAHESIWKDFYSKHDETINPIIDSEKSIDELRNDNPGIDLSTLLKKRDEEWAHSVDAKIKQNFGKANSNLENLKDSNQPIKLLSAAFDKLNAIDSTSKSFLFDDNVLEIVKEINSLTYEFKNAIKQARKQ